MPDLFDLVDLPSWLQVPEVDTETATRVRRAASGWLQDATGLASWPDPVPDRLWVWAVELAAIAFRDPDGTASETIDDYTRQQDRARRAEILTAARRAYNTGATSPQYSFPDPDWHWSTVAVVNN
jgi:hypothetical protein